MKMEDLKHRLTTQHEKDLKKLQSKLSKVEIARDELVKERNDVRNEVGVLKIEARASTARETALRASVSLSLDNNIANH
jgi:predicted  nucleic acid-binding Zn-ribbon protein